jgi:hypothetical protein
MPKCKFWKFFSIRLGMVCPFLNVNSKLWIWDLDSFLLQMFYLLSPNVVSRDKILIFDFDLWPVFGLADFLLLDWCWRPFQVFFIKSALSTISFLCILIFWTTWISQGRWERFVIILNQMNILHKNGSSL